MDTSLFLRRVDMEANEKRDNKDGRDMAYHILHACAQNVGSLLVLAVTIWTIYFREGLSLAWRTNLHAQFNWHYPLTTLGMVYLFGNGMLTFRTFQSTKKPTLKVTHAATLLAALVLTGIGLYAAYDARDHVVPPKAHFSTVHSLFGIIAIAGFAGQWLGSLAVFYLPRLKGLRGWMLPFHRYFGLVLFILACTSAVTGFGKAKIKVVKPAIISEDALLKIMSLVLYLFAFIVIYLVNNYPYKRRLVPLEQTQEHVLGRASLKVAYKERKF